MASLSWFARSTPMDHDPHPMLQGIEGRQKMADTRTTTMNATSVTPALTVNDLQQSMAFFAGLGFEVEDRWEHEGTLIGVMLKAGDARLGLNQDDGKKGTGRVKGLGMRLYVETTDDIDALASRAKAAGIPLVREPHDTEWGTRAFEVTEPSGFALTIGSRSAS